MNEKNYEEFYKDTLVLDDASIQIKDPYENIPECIHTPVSGDDCKPLELKCDARCQGAGICPMNPFSECYNMTMEDYKVFLDEMKTFETYCNEFLDSEEGQAMLAEMREVLDTTSVKEEKQNE